MGTVFPNEVGNGGVYRQTQIGDARSSLDDAVRPYIVDFLPIVLEPLGDGEMASVTARLDERSWLALVQRLAADAEWWSLSREPRTLAQLCQLATDAPRFAALSNAELIDLVSCALLASALGEPANLERFSEGHTPPHPRRTETSAATRLVAGQTFSQNAVDSPPHLALEGLAAETLRADSDELDIHRCHEIIGEATAGALADDKSGELLSAILESGILCAGEAGHKIRFRSPLFQCNFAALSLRRSFQRGTSLRGQLPPHPPSRTWMRTLSLAFALHGNRLSFLRDLVGPGAEEEAVLVAARCLADQDNADWAREYLRIDPLNYDLHYRFGRAFRSLARPDLARHAFAAAAKLEPDRARAHGELADVLLELGELDRAASEYRIASSLSGDKTSGHLGLARVFSQQGSRPKAMAEVRAAEESLKLAQAEIHHQMGHICEVEGRLDDAQRHYQAAVEVSPTSHCWLHLGLLQHASGEMDAALKSLAVAVALQPDSFDAHRELGLLHESRGDYERAAEELKRALSSPGRCAVDHVDLGRVYRKMGQLPPALIELQRAICLDPSCAPAFAELGLVYETKGLLESALGAYRRASQLSPRQAEYIEHVGWVLRLIGRLDEAEVELRAAARLNPSRAELFERLGSVLVEQGRYADALADYQAAASLSPGVATHLLSIGMMHSRLGEYSAALQALTEALRLAEVGQDKLFSTDPATLAPRTRLAAIHDALGFALESLGQHDDALQHYCYASELIPTTERYWTRQGRLCQKMGRPEEATSALERSASLQPGDASLWAELGNARESAGKMSQALQAYETAIQLDRENEAGSETVLRPNAAIPYLRSGLILRGQGRTDQARAAFESALDLFPDCAEAHLQLGLLLLEAGSFDAALLNCLAAVDSEPGNPAYRVALGRCLGVRGNSNEATAQLRKAVSLAPDLPEAHYRLALVYLEHGLLKDALASASRAAELGAADAAYARFAGDIAGQLGENELALRFLEEAVRRDPANPRIRFALGGAFERAGQAIRALEEYHRASDLSPDSIEYEFEIGRLNVLLGRYRQAIEVLLRTVARDPAHAQAQALLGDSLARLGYFESALDRYELAVQVQPRAPATWRGKGMALAALDRLGEAERALRQAVALECGNVESREALARVLVKLGLWGDAYHEITAIVDASGLNGSRARCLSDVCCALGRYQEALDWLMRCAELERDANALAELGAIVDVVGEQMEARRYLLRALEYSGKPYLRRRLGILAARLGSHQEAVEHLGALAGQPYADVYAGYSLAAAYECQGKLDDSLRQLDELATRVPRSAGLLAARGSLGRRVAEASGQSAWRRNAPVVQGAVDDLNRALALNPALILAHEELGIICELTGDTDKAIEHYLAAVDINPTHPSALCRIARTFQQANREDDALRILKDALDAGYSDAAVFHQLGMVYEGKGMQAEALEAYRRASALRGDQADYCHSVARALAWMRRPEALGEMERAVAMRPQEAEWRWELGVLLEGRGNLERAIGEYRQATVEAPKQSKYHSSLGRLLCRTDRLSEAHESLVRAISLEPSADNYAEMSRLRLKQGRFQDALKHAERALKLAPDDPGHRLAHAVALKHFGQTEKAMSALERLVADRPDFAEARFELGLAEEERGLADRALPHYHHAAELRGDKVAYRLALARANRLLGRYQEASDIVRRLLAGSLRNPDVLYEAARLAEAQRKLPEAIETYQRAIRAEPRGVFFRDMAHALAEAKRFEEALEAMRSALKHEPRSADWASEMGEISEQRGDDLEAIERYRQAIKLDPRGARHHRNLGVIFKRQGRYDDAIAELKRALELDPNYQEAYQQLSAAQASALLRKTIGVHDKALHRPERETPDK